MNHHNLELIKYLDTSPWSNVSIDTLGHTIGLLKKQHALPSKIWLITPTEDQVSLLLEVLLFWCGQDIHICGYPADDTDTLSGMSPPRTLIQRRVQTLNKWYSDEATIVVSSTFGWMHQNLSPTDIQSSCIHCTIGMDYAPSDFIETLQFIGYLPSREVDSPGIFRHTGDNIHIWGVGESEPIRLSFFDTELEHIHRFRDGNRISESQITILPAREMALSPDRLQTLKRNLVQYVRKHGRGRELFRQISGNFQDGIWFPGAEDYLPSLCKLVNPALTMSDASLLFINPSKCLDEANRWTTRLHNRWNLFTKEQTPLIEKNARFDAVETLSNAIQSHHQIFSEPQNSGLVFSTHSVTQYQTPQHNIGPLLEQIERWLRRRFQVIFVANSHNRLQRLASMLQSHQKSSLTVSTIDSAQPGLISLMLGTVEEGWIDEQRRQVLLSIEYIFNMGKLPHQRMPTSLRDAVISNIAEIQSGDIVVHRENGIGQFIGITQRTVQNTQIDCIQIEYANNTFFYMPIDKIEDLYRYRSMGPTPKLDKLGSPSWAKRFKKVRNSVGALAEELIKQMASRANQEGYAYEGVPQLLNDFSLSFPYQETPDQQQAIDDVLSDLALPKPMNRLIVGDVGFGKTEVAMRAAVRIVAEGHQVALLCPTTILAIQHHRSFVDRCIDFGIRVAVITRLQTAQTKKKLFKKLQDGEVDILIGTHAMLSKNLRFKRLGLVIVDEEHRFGVKQKEALQRLSQLNPECPTEYMAMSATPIPRTLHLAMSGLREVSVIATPPAGRIAIQTRFMRYNIKDIAKQILFEIKRGGQAFFVHNVVKELTGIAETLQEHLPNITIEVASGQHSKKHLEQVMLNIWEGRTQLLVCTTIIENGIDLPNVNTILINDAYKMGLAQLYQLRGRVGRGREQGYCTLIIPERGLKDDALSRMTALKEYTALGSGFAIANADLEIRGSGDLLGKDQSGHIDAIGLDIYIDLLQEAIQELKSTRQISYVPQVSIPTITAVIPVEYIADMQDRLQSYRQLAMATHEDDLQALLDLWEHTFGPPPQMALNAVGMAEIRLWAKRIGVERVDWLKSRVRFISHPTSDLDWKDVELLCNQHPRLDFVYLQHGIWEMTAKFSYEDNSNPIPYVIQVMGLFTPLLSQDG